MRIRIPSETYIITGAHCCCEYEKVSLYVWVFRLQSGAIHEADLNPRMSGNTVGVVLEEVKRLHLHAC
jgi:hypothetical protein